MVLKIRDTNIFLSTSKEIWDVVNKIYTITKDVVNESYSQTIVHIPTQDIGVELDHYRVIKFKCFTDAVTLNELIEQDKSYVFLVVLNSKIDKEFKS